MTEMHYKKLFNFDLPAGSSLNCASVIVIPEVARQAIKNLSTTCSLKITQNI